MSDVLKKYVNGEIVDMTAEEIAERTTRREEDEAYITANQYKSDRQAQYPSIGEQLDMQYWDAVNGTTTWKDAIAQVKADNPKPE